MTAADSHAADAQSTGSHAAPGRRNQREATMQPTRTITARREGTTGGWRAVGATPSPSRGTRPDTGTEAAARAITVARAARRARAAFTLTELLIVIGLIVLIVALAVPAFNAMTGGRSVDAATNQLSAMLGRVRMEAIGLQEPRGLMFYRDPATQRIAARIVRIASSDLATGIPGFDLVEDRDAMLLPVGVGLQMVDDAAMSGSGPTARASDDRYIGYNKRLGNDDTLVPVGGVILFDQNGRLSSRRYGFRAKEPGKRPNQLVVSQMGKLLFGEQANIPGNNQVLHNVRTGGPDSMRTQFGFVLYDEEPFKNLFGTTDDPYGDQDPQLNRGGNVTATSPEGREEAWLDQNAVPVLINRYNGTLIRGE